ncbi:type III-B CRISPR-associated protein Cas10/Cmr2 [Thermosulfurimonas sp. F29]|uniref:type III-B CRISPR-associated protein Cas10/Cmr2 n=1 Tax=Thermosulfurimonas sp. F29 TaxID=2867247 RepID=UPI001C83BE44|nr:type III-B CRISPR-associated protein Cas10/Cmr2 [Thermosulfurimonas sp. F29]MBX6423232.1 type III-B CRISPR-associated protein Cas10/Cmr2 [Thermosulfurimonas sp. F29]
MSAFKRSEEYWREKLAVFLHDPPDKALSIREHVSRAARLKDILYISAEESLLKKADQVASGLDRTFLPRREEGGQIEFPHHPRITHPTGKIEAFDLRSLSTGAEESLTRLVEHDTQRLNDFFSVFHYFRHVLPWRLGKENIGGLSWRWHYLPADTRLPDHSIWQHCALTSALYSCYRLSSNRKASLMLFSLTPVQNFIARSRKLRDYWTASLILSWLASEGLWTVICLYGSDHIIYPFPVDQALIESRLDEKCGFGEWAERYQRETRAATLPNKFLFLVPEGEEKNTAKKIEETVKGVWLDLAERVRNLVEERAFGKVPAECLIAFKKIFSRQTEHFWEFHWTAVPLLDESLLNKGQDFIPENLVVSLRAYLEEARKKNFPYLNLTEKFFYPASHDLLARGLAAEKLSPPNTRAEEPGVKCHLHPDLEALRFSCVECAEAGMEKCLLHPERRPDPNPRPREDPCWQKIRKAFPQSEFKDTERLSAIALIKRLAYRAVSDGHPLYSFFKEAEKFPSSTEMALSEWLNRAEEDMKELGLSSREVAEILHRKEAREKNEIEEIPEGEEKEIRNKVEKLLSRRKDRGDEILLQDRYYAILLMDGDRMGKLLSGGFAATWESVLHPELVERIRNGKVSKNFVEFWQDFLSCRRLLSPATHGAISQALAHFALYTVPYLVETHGGKLIYAGGDDVCAIFPVSTAISAARRIGEAYNWAFVRLRRKTSILIREGRKMSYLWNETQEIREASELNDDDLLLLHLGPGEKISISGGLLIVHHKWPLRAAVERAHELLNLAKDSGRAALALELHRRAGERRTFVAGFRDTVKFSAEEVLVWEAFRELVEAFARKELSSSFAYRPRELAEGLRALRDQGPDRVSEFIRTQIRSERLSHHEEVSRLSRMVTAVLLGRRKYPQGESDLGFEALEIARFLGEAWRRHAHKTVA